MTFEEAWNDVEKVAFFICNKFHIDGYAMDDKMQEARIEVLPALKKYDESRGASFKTYYQYKLRSRLNKILMGVKRQKNYFNVKQNSVNNTDDTHFFDFVSSDMRNPEEQTIRDKQLEEINHFISLLTKELQDVIKLKALGYNNREIAEKTGLKNPVKIRMRLIMLKELFESKPTIEEINIVNKRYEDYQKVAKRRKRKERKVT
jgi:RNA polymerase sigma factor (sigma-70 family)